MKKKQPKIIELDGNKLSFVSVREVMAEAIRLAKSRKATILLNYNSEVIQVTKESKVNDLVQRYFKQ